MMLEQAKAMLELVMYENTSADLKTLLAEGEKITPKAWRKEFNENAIEI